ncbi:hypothetical protein CAPTEDRAFT_188601 [Capitella teleta]|uniref:Glycoside hydrolase family 65 central catalytic domain-containing protein n=1 Tax=Capitella teleta TaxID=283909 RepID=R7VLT6_CAPTE|nr:hypothetical protein CAPTEDRAFT_188601 [Capitella teleta]|eukprot:ELU17895.1 hypothetical protein CAPTEDRAFT_188601 [Capitella teleta]
MWDNEMHILPTFLLFHPNTVKKALRYRSTMAPRALSNAEKYGGKGYHFPWESGFYGEEVSPEADECPECSWHKYHTTGAVGWLIRMYYSATRDRDYRQNVDYNGCDMTREIARFFADRAIYKPEHGRYDIDDCTGPDENHPRVNNNAYTLVLASLAIHYARYFACLCQRTERDEVPDEWIHKALYLNLPFDNFKKHLRSLIYIYELQ